MSLPSARPIAFNRRLSPAWMKEGLRLRAEGVDGASWVEAMRVMVGEEVSGNDSIQKSMRYLRHTLVEPGELEPLRQEAIHLFQTSQDPEKVRVLSWGLAAAAYPFLQEVAGVIGRMLRVQPAIKLAQFQRKLAESFGEKETVRRSGRYAVGFILELGFLRRTSIGGGYSASPRVHVADPDLAGWVMKSWFFANAYQERVDRVAVLNHPGLFPFDAVGVVQFAIQTGVLSVERMSMSQDTLHLIRRR